MLYTILGQNPPRQPPTPRTKPPGQNPPDKPSPGQTTPPPPDIPPGQTNSNNIFNYY